MLKPHVLALALLSLPAFLGADGASPTVKPTLTGKELEAAQNFNPTEHRSKSATAKSDIELHTASGTIVSIDISQKSITLDHGAFADGFQGAGTSTYTLQNGVLAKISRFKPGQRIEFIVQHQASANSIWTMRVFHK
jgi:Cu/Ag efflux protein CusF